MIDLSGKTYQKTLQVDDIPMQRLLALELRLREFPLLLVLFDVFVMLAQEAIVASEEILLGVSDTLPQAAGWMILQSGHS